MTTYGPKADRRARRDARLRPDRVQAACDTVCIAGAILLLTLSGVLAKWLDAGGPLP